MVNYMFKLPKDFLEIVHENYTQILAEDLKKGVKRLKNLAKTGTVDELQHELEKHRAWRDGIEELFFADVVHIGPFAFKVGKVKRALLAQLDGLDEALLSSMERRVEADAELVVKKVEEVLAEVTRDETDYKDIESVVKSKEFVAALPQKKKEIKELRKAVRRKMKVLDKYLFRFNEEKKEIVLASIWAKPIQIDI